MGVIEVSQWELMIFDRSVTAVSGSCRYSSLAFAERGCRLDNQASLIVCLFRGTLEVRSQSPLALRKSCWMENSPSFEAYTSPRSHELCAYQRVSAPEQILIQSLQFFCHLGVALGGSPVRSVIRAPWSAWVS